MTSGLRHAVPRPVRLAVSRWLASRHSAAFEQRVADMVAAPGPIIAGPWLGEVGFELLYWVPFLAWCAERFEIAPERWVVVSRGGTASWYRGMASRYADVFDQVTPEEFRAQHDQRVAELGEQKQTRGTAFEERLVVEVARRYGLTTWSLLHPSEMYALMNPFWWGHTDTSWVHRHARFRRLPAPDLVGAPVIAGPYVATKFYFNECFPATEANREFAARTLRALAKEGPVIALSTGLALDDHDAFAARESGVQHLPEGIDPARNLQVQTAVVAGAREFVGTYGGFSYLAPFHGVPSRAFYSHAAGFSARHLTLVQEAIAAIGSTRLDVHAVADAPVLTHV
jgi:hypothetical protein